LVLIVCSSPAAMAETEDQTLTTALVPSVSRTSATRWFEHSLSLFRRRKWVNRLPDRPNHDYGAPSGSRRPSPGSHSCRRSTGLHIGWLTTSSYEGEVEAEATLSLAPGAYLFGPEVFDTSTLCAPIARLVGNPVTEFARLFQTSGQNTTPSSEQTRSVDTVYGGTLEDVDGIHNALRSEVTSAVVEIGKSFRRVNWFACCHGADP
jgi:hypothetical protein